MARKQRCAFCGHKEIDIKDCGYSNFNVGSVTCEKCSYSITVNGADEIEDYITAWNKQVNAINIVNGMGASKLRELIFEIDMCRNEVNNDCSIQYNLKSIRDKQIKVDIDSKAIVIAEELMKQLKTLTLDEAMKIARAEVEHGNS